MTDERNFQNEPEHGVEAPDEAFTQPLRPNVLEPLTVSETDDPQLRDTPVAHLAKDPDAHASNERSAAENEPTAAPVENEPGPTEPEATPGLKEPNSEPEPEPVVAEPSNDEKREPDARTTRIRRSRGGATAVPKLRRTEKAERRHRAVVGALARSSGTITTVALVAGAAWALGWMPLPSVSVQPQGIGVTPPAGAQQRVCAGPLLQVGIGGQASQASPVGEAEEEVAAIGGADPKREALGDQGPSSYLQPATEGEPRSIAVAQSFMHNTPKTAGFGASNCIAPASSQWVLAGNTQVGYTSALDIINPSGAEARVNFRVFTPDGVKSPGIGEIVLQPGERTTVSLGGVATDQQTVAVELISTGAPVAAFVHETYTDTLDPKGAEVAEASNAPSKSQVIPGVAIAFRPQVEVTDPATLGTAVRVLNPGDATTPVTIEVVNKSGKVDYTTNFELGAGHVVDYPLGQVDNGEYTVRVTAEQPIVAAARVAPLDASEFAWIAASPELGDSAVVAVPAGDEPRLAIHNPTDAARKVEVDGKSVTIEPGATSVSDADKGSIELTNASGLQAAVHFTTSERYSGFPVLPGISAGDQLTVYR